MIEKLREELIKLSEEPIDEKEPSISLTPVFIWAAVAGIVGGLTPFVFPSNHGMLLSSIASIMFLILTAKPLFKWLYTKDNLNNLPK